MEFNRIEENSRIAEENFKPGLTLQVNYSVISSDTNSNGVIETDVILTEQNAPQLNQGISEDSIRHGEGDVVVLSKENSVAGARLGSNERSTSDKKLSQAIVRISKPLCADYRSESESESIDSESDSSVSTDDATDSSSESGSISDDNESCTADTKAVKRKEKNMNLADLPPIEDLKISVPEDACIEVGKISSIVDTLVVVESYKGTAALDIDTVLFLDSGKRSLGKVFDILGPISEPVYTVRFNNTEQIMSLNIKKEQKVYYAPKTQHTMFIFLSEVLKHKGSDASWKDNVEAPSEFQDFSDDEEERLFKSKQKNEPDTENAFSDECGSSRKRSFNRMKQSSTILQPPRLRHPAPPLHGAPRNPTHRPFPPARSPYNVPPYSFATLPPIYHPSRISGPPFPTFGALPFPSHFGPFQQPFNPPFQRNFFFQQRTHPWGRHVFGSPPPPPPPPPPEVQGLSYDTDGKP